MKVTINPVQTDNHGSTIAVQICEKPGIISEGLGLSTWGAAYVLASALWKISIPTPTPPKTLKTTPTILELGAGTGLVGLTAALLWKTHVILTDLPSILPGIAANISLNAALLAENSGASATPGTLDWRNPHKLLLSNPSDTVLNSSETQIPLILAADTIYSDEHPELLVSTITLWLARTTHARFIMCYPLRMAYIEHIRDFWERMEAAGLECVQEGKEEGVEEWNEVPNTPFEWCVWRWKEGGA